LVKTNDDVARKADYFSPGFRVLEHRDGKVTRARLEEISLTGDPVNPACRVFERRELGREVDNLPRGYTRGEAELARRAHLRQLGKDNVTAPRALALSDKQLAMLQRAAASLPIGERDHFLQSVAAHLTGVHTDDALIAAINAALDAAAASLKRRPA
jgi:hypothetical protein